MAILGLLFVAVPAAAQELDPRLAEAYDGAGIAERLGRQIPADIRLLDHNGNAVRVGEIFSNGRPVVLNFVYFDCPMLCNVVLDEFTDTMTGMEWRPGEEFDVITISISPSDTPETARAARVRYAGRLGVAGEVAGWHFLTGSEEEIRRLADAAGFQYKLVEDTGQYVHPAVLTFVAPDRTITRYLYGIDYPERKVRNAIVEATDGKVGTTLDRLIMYCFQFDPTKNAYVLHATILMKLGALLTVIALVTLFVILRRREREAAGTHPAFS